MALILEVSEKKALVMSFETLANGFQSVTADLNTKTT